MLNKRAYAAERVCEQLRRYKEEYNPTYTVVLGDFNDIPMSYTYMKLRMAGAMLMQSVDSVLVFPSMND